MPIIADTHVHLYPLYDLNKTFIHLAQNLGRLAVKAGHPGAARVACLTERQGQHVLRDLSDGTLRLDRADVTVRAAGEPGALSVALAGETLHIIAGRQFVGAERVEILGLAVELDLADGAPAATYIERILAADGVPVLSWAPGKWMFRRAAVIRELIARYGARLLLGDTTLRPLGWGEPGLMCAGRRQGLGVIAGSDPLPVTGDDRHAGTYATLIDTPFDPARPVTALRAALRKPAPRRLGRRGTPFTVALRLAANARAKVA